VKRWGVPLAVRTRLTLWYTAILFVMLLVVSVLSYSRLRWTIMQDLDTSLLTVAQVIHDTGYSGADLAAGAGPEMALRQILGPEFYDKFFQLVDPEGHPAARSTQLRGRALPLSAAARADAARGVRTFETVRLPTGERVRLLTLPITRGGQLTHLVQVGIPLERTEHTLARYLESLLVLVPLGLALAAAGGIIIARAALQPVDAMSRTARRITTGEDLAQRIVLRGTGDELDHLAETLNAMLARLEGLFAQMRRFAADAAHELRTPLTVLKGEVEVALRAERSSEEYRRVLTSSLEEVERLTRLAEDLLLLSRFAARTPPPRSRVELDAVLVDAFDVGVRLGQAQGVAVRPGEVCPAAVEGDAAALRRAIVNLVDNAVKYTPAGGKVELSLGCADGRAAIVVSDTGIGIDPADGQRVFEPFVRLDTPMPEAGGAGLGLAIARSIVRAHGGTITVESRLGAGSTFTIYLPLA
jgi:heavy metal sensor kinase